MFICMLVGLGLSRNMVFKLKPKEREEKKGHDPVYFYSEYSLVPNAFPLSSIPVPKKSKLKDH